MQQEGEFRELASQQEREIKEAQLKKEKLAIKAKKMNELLENYKKFYDKLCIDEMKLMIESYEKNRKQIMSDQNVDIYKSKVIYKFKLMFGHN